MNKTVLPGMMGLSTPAMALDVEAISKGLVEADPWGQNAEILPLVLSWIGLIVVIALVAKVLFAAVDRLRGWRHSRRHARASTDQWIMDMGELLKCPPPKGLGSNSSPAAWHKYRMAVKQALLTELQRSRQLAAQANQRNVG